MCLFSNDDDGTALGLDNFKKKIVSNGQFFISSFCVEFSYKMAGGGGGEKKFIIMLGVLLYSGST